MKTEQLFVHRHNFSNYRHLKVLSFAQRPQWQSASKEAPSRLCLLCSPLTSCVVPSHIVSDLVCVNRRRWQKWWCVSSETGREQHRSFLLGHFAHSLFFWSFTLGWTSLHIKHSPCRKELRPAVNHVSEIESRSSSPSENLRMLWHMPTTLHQPHERLSQSHPGKLLPGLWPFKTLCEILNTYCLR